MAKRHGSELVNGDLVKRLMAHKGWYSEDLAKATGLSKRVIDKVMAGKSCSLKTIRLVARSFDKKAEELFLSRTTPEATKEFVVQKYLNISHDIPLVIPETEEGIGYLKDLMQGVVKAYQHHERVIAYNKDIKKHDLRVYLAKAIMNDTKVFGFFTSPFGFEGNLIDDLMSGGGLPEYAYMLLKGEGEPTDNNYNWVEQTFLSPTGDITMLSGWLGRYDAELHPDFGKHLVDLMMNELRKVRDSQPE